MKVVLFCGGLGLRLRESGDNVPKPMVHIGYRPILWHVMRYYAHFGHADFILCLGYRGDEVKRYFLHYDECVSNDFVLSAGGRQLELLNSDIHDWRITFVDTGLHANIGQRLKAVEPYLDGEERFLANYSDGLTDLPLPEQIEHFEREDKIASFLCVKPNLSLHMVSLGADGRLLDIESSARSNLRINGGYFAFKRDVFRFIRDGEELVEQPFRRLLAEDQLLAYRYDGFWLAMDTFKDRQRLEDIEAQGAAPWEVWQSKRSAKADRAAMAARASAVAHDRDRVGQLR